MLKFDNDREKLIKYFPASEIPKLDDQFRAVYKDDKPFCIFKQWENKGSVFSFLYAIENPWYWIPYEENIWDELGTLLESDSEWVKYTKNYDFYCYWSYNGSIGSYEKAEASILEKLIQFKRSENNYYIEDVVGHDPYWQVDYVVWKVVKNNLLTIQKILKFDGYFPIITVGQSGSIRIRYAFQPHWENASISC